MIGLIVCVVVGIWCGRCWLVLPLVWVSLIVLLLPGITFLVLLIWFGFIVLFMFDLLFCYW